MNLEFIFRLIKKAICCLKRRRRLSCDPVPLTDIGVVSDVEKDVTPKCWSSLENSLTNVTATKPVDPVQQRIELYRQNKIAAANEVKEDRKIDYFQDMTPKIVKQTKMLLRPKECDEQERPVSSSLVPDLVFSSSELGVWEDSQSWEAQTDEDWDANSMIKEKKRVDREKKMAQQQRKRLERESRGRSSSAARLS